MGDGSVFEGADGVRVCIADAQVWPAQETWLGSGAMILSKSESQCCRDLVSIKKRYQNSVFSR